MVVCTSLFGQSEMQIKIYQNTDSYSVVYNDFQETDELNFNRISIAFDLRTRRDLLHELELFIPELSTSIHDVKFPMAYAFRDVSWFDARIDTYSFRYELSKVFKPSKAINFSLGVAVNPFFTRTDYKSSTSYIYDVENKVYGFSANFVPRVMINVSRRFSIDLNIPLKIYDLKVDVTRVMNLSIPREQQESQETENIFFENVYTVRMGVGYKLK